MPPVTEGDRPKDAPHISTLRVAGALLLMRLGLAYFFMVWGINKILAADQTAKLFEYFYELSLPTLVPYELGIAEVALAAAVALGLWRRPVYLLALLVHSATIVVTIGSLATPFKIEDGFPVNRLYAASVPTWAALMALYLLRGWDRFSLDVWLREYSMFSAENK